MCYYIIVRELTNLYKGGVYIMSIVKIIIVVGLVAFLGYQIFMLIKTIKQQKKVNQDDLKEVNTSEDKK